MKITPENYLKIEEKVLQTVKKINDHYKINMPVPAIFYDVHSTTGGIAKYNSMSVHFNPSLLKENFEVFLKTTVPHEVCHIGVWQKYLHEKKKTPPKAHGQEWKLMMWVVGAPARRCHQYDVEDVKKSVAQYEYKCGCTKTTTVGARIHNKIKNGSLYQCKKCSVTLKNGSRLLTKSFSRASPNGTTKTIED